MALMIVLFGFSGSPVLGWPKRNLGERDGTTQILARQAS